MISRGHEQPSVAEPKRPLVAPTLGTALHLVDHTTFVQLVIGGMSGIIERSKGPIVQTYWLSRKGQSIMVFPCRTGGSILLLVESLGNCLGRHYEEPLLNRKSRLEEFGGVTGCLDKLGGKNIHDLLEHMGTSVLLIAPLM